MDKSNLQKGEIAIYKISKNEMDLKVKLEQETVWLFLSWPAILFGRGKDDKNYKCFYLQNLTKNNYIIKTTRYFNHTH